ncbi:MAG TPA: ABC transporter ATP-binding protein [Clostridiales bacterium]|nr:ABC transporter ATP-binding protein [Clostridiales bacterium]
MTGTKSGGHGTQSSRPEEAVVAAEGLFKTFGRTRALHGLSLTVRRGEKYGLVGPNGSGKTTLIRAVVGLIVPDSGTVKVFGERVPSAGVSKRVGYMTQSAALYEDLTVRENLRFFARLFGTGTGRRLSARVEETLELVDLVDRGDSPVRTLSGGMRQRASLAAALIHEPELLLLDEPTVGVDPELRRALWDHFDRLNAQGRTFIISTHIMDEAERCDRVGFLRAGRLIAEGTPRSLRERAGSATLEEAYLWHAGRSDGGETE